MSSNPPPEIAFEPDGRLFVRATFDTARVDLSAARTVEWTPHEYETTGPLLATVVSPDKKWKASVSGNEASARCVVGDDWLPLDACRDRLLREEAFGSFDVGCEAMKRSTIVVLAVAGLAACKVHRDPPVTVESTSAVPPQVAIAHEWPAIPTLDASRPPPKPIPFPAGSKDKRFVVFSASWCHGCVASVPGDADLARRYEGRIEVAVALQEASSSFASSSMARWLSGVRVYDQDSTKALAVTCGVSAIPAACLLDGTRVLWTGNADDGAAVIDGFLSGHLDDVRSREKEAEKRPTLASLHGLAGRENAIAWDLVDKQNPTAAELALGVELARDAVESTGALDFAILDTYAVGLTKTGDHAGAARVSRRLIAMCDAVKGDCSEERSRAEAVLRAE